MLCTYILHNASTLVTPVRGEAVFQNPRKAAALTTRDRRDRTQNLWQGGAKTSGQGEMSPPPHTPSTTPL